MFVAFATRSQYKRDRFVLVAVCLPVGRAAQFAIENFVYRSSAVGAVGELGETQVSGWASATSCHGQQMFHLLLETSIVHESVQLDPSTGCRYVQPQSRDLIGEEHGYETDDGT